jgi:hypothetical protein
MSREEIWWIETTLSDSPRIKQGIPMHNAAFAALADT